jgi:HSP20 family molecular chaperone IbpA
MNDETEVSARQSAQTPEGRGDEPTILPPMDIFEDARGITLVADMPGVSKDRLDIQVDKDTLLVEGDARIQMPEGMDALYADVRSTRYRRSFTLSGELDIEKIDAVLKDGVLTLRIPKREQLQPRKIEVRAT